MNYFDHAASTPLYPEVLDVLTQALREDFANPSAQHSLGQALHDKIEIFREDFLKAIGAQSDDTFIFTSSATESNNLVIHGLNLLKNDVVVYCKADHSSVTVPVEKLAELHQVSLKEIQLEKDGSVNVDDFISLLDEKVKLVILTQVNNQNGVIVDLEKLVSLVKAKTNAHIHVDAVQSFGKIKNIMIPGIDSLCIAAHKIGGPKGIAGLYLKNNHKVQALLFGGGHEKGLRSSTLNYPLIAGFHSAMKISLRDLEDNFYKISKMNEKILINLSSNIPSMQFSFLKTSPYVIGFIIPGIPSDVIVRHLETRQVFISTSSACSSKKTGFDSTLHAMKIPERFHKNFLRISLGAVTTETEVEALIKQFLEVWGSIKHMQKR